MLLAPAVYFTDPDYSSFSAEQQAKYILFLPQSSQEGN